MENICEWENCDRNGAFKAPKEKDNSKKFMWLCKEHIRTFNKKWDYFEGMSQKEIENFLKSDATWHRPTQKFGSLNNFFNILWNNALNDKFNLFNEKKTFNNTISKDLSKKDKEAFKIMNLGSEDDWNIIQKKFKALVKKFHPDKNFGNKMYEDELKKITLAYNHLRTLFKSKRI